MKADIKIMIIRIIIIIHSNRPLAPRPRAVAALIVTNMIMIIMIIRTNIKIMIIIMIHSNRPLAPRPRAVAAFPGRLCRFFRLSERHPSGFPSFFLIFFFHFLLFWLFLLAFSKSYLSGRRLPLFSFS